MQISKCWIICLIGLAVILPMTTQAQEAQTVDRIIAVVNEEIILESEVLQYVQDIILRNRQQYSQPEQVAALRDQVLTELVNQKILLAAAEADTNIIVEDRQVDQTLDERINQVQQDLGGEERLVEYYGKPIRQIRREFRKQVRDNLMVERLRQMKMASVSVTKSEVEDFFERNKANLPTLPERVHLAHLLIPIEPTEEATEDAKTKADSLFNLLLTGSDFDQLSIENSDDRASGAKGGLLGTTQRGDLVPEYEEVAFGLEEGEVSSPVRSRFGYHIIRLNWRRGEKINTSHILVKLTPSALDEERAFLQAQDLRTRILEGDDFAELAKEFSSDEETAKDGGDLGWFDVPQMPEEFRIVTRDLNPGELTEPFKSRVGVHIVKVIDREKPRAPGLKEDWDRLSRMALMEKQDRMYQEWITEKRKDVYIEEFTSN
ncbi:peptidylprolyl isomerase [bacterium]|nr:peptidylprolyl isomerase [bacterium]